MDRSSISEDGFVYEALLAGLPARSVRAMLDVPSRVDGLATIHGVQFILPQTVGHATPGDSEAEEGGYERQTEFNPEAPVRAALFDSTPVAAHPALEDGVLIEDVHDLVPLSIVDERHHATAMASLILRGDLSSDGEALSNSRLVSVPLLIDNDNNGTSSPPNRLFVDLVYGALVTLFAEGEPLQHGIFVVNFSIGIRDMQYGGRISALARLMDWWAAKEGVLFVISAGNISEKLVIEGVRASMFRDAENREQRAMARASLRKVAFDRTLLAPAECLNGIAVGALSLDLANFRPPVHTDIVSLEGDGEFWPQMTSAFGLGPLRAIKPDLLAAGGKQEVRVWPSVQDTILSPVEGTQRTGLVVAAPTRRRRRTQKLTGTSLAAALTTRAILQSAEALTGEDGPFEGRQLFRQELALLTRALAINSARWPQEANTLYQEELHCRGASKHVRAKEEVCRHFGHGVLTSELMRRSPDRGVTLVGLGSVRKDQARVFKIPLPSSLSGDRTPRSMRVTLAWFSPVDSVRAQYRLASLEAIAFDEEENEQDSGWCLDLKSSGPDANMIKRGTVRSRRLVNRTQKAPTFEDGDEVPIYVQCRDASAGGLSPDEDIAFAIAVTLEVEADVQYDIHQEVEHLIRVRIRNAA